MPKIVIQKGIPLRPYRGRYPELQMMEMWDSFLTFDNKIRDLVNSAGPRIRRRFSVRKSEGGYRVWRVPLDYKPGDMPPGASLELKIESGIPIPPLGCNHEMTSVLKQMKVGENHLFRDRKVRDLIRYYGRVLKRKYSVRTQDDGYMVWRVK